MRGAGHFYAKDTNRGMSLLAAEIVSIFMMGLSVSEVIQPQEDSQATSVSRAVFYTGIAIFGGSWLYDVIFSGFAVDKFNNENNFLTQEKKDNAGSAGQ
jgi:flagellar biosynthesis protein FliR